MTTKDFREMRLKENKTEVEMSLLEHREKLININEIFVEYSKWHLNDKQALREIRKQAKI